MWLNQMKIGAKLIVGFAAVIVLTVILAVIGVVQLMNIDDTYSNVLDGAVVRNDCMLEIKASYAKIRRMGTMAVLEAGDLAAIEQERTNYGAEMSNIKDAFDKFMYSLANDDEINQEYRAEREQDIQLLSAKIQDEYGTAFNLILHNAEQNDPVAAKRTMNEAAVIAAGINDMIDTFTGISKLKIASISAAASQEAIQSLVILIAVAASAVLIAVVVTIVIARVIKKGILSVTEAAHKISQGDFNVTVGSNGKDEIADLSNSLLNLKSVIQNLTSDIKCVASDFTKGKTDARVKASDYQGEFQVMANHINDTFADLIDDSLYAIELVTEFGDGNFHVPIKEFPGKKAVFTSSFQAVQSNFIRINHDIEKIIKGATQGNLTLSMDAELYKGGWNVIAAGINGLLAAVIDPIREAISVLEQLSGGHLDVSVNGDYKGEFAAMKKALNDTLAMLASYIKEINAVLGSMAGKDLTVSITRPYVGEFDEIKQAINSIVSVFNQLIGEIDGASWQIAMASKQVADFSMHLAEGTTEQASSIEELNATIEDIASRTEDNAQGAGHANELAIRAKNNAEKGNVEMQEMLMAMKDIKESSDSILKIIKVMDDIAFQTNLLALNAAVEAARAGAQGKGFSVVAAEVKSLAGKSLEASKETAMLIKGSVHRIGEGAKRAEGTAKALETIVSEINEISGTIDEVTKASMCQTEAIGQVNIGINQISTVTQTNSATSEEQASASQELSSQADVFRAMVSQFKL